MEEKFIIQNINSRWTVNGKTYDELTDFERLYLDEFIKDARLKMESEENDKLNDDET